MHSQQELWYKDSLIHCRVGSEATQAHAPYGEAIDELRHLPSLNSPTAKLECLVHMSKLIIQCIDSYHEVHGKGSIDIGVWVSPS